MAIKVDIKGLDESLEKMGKLADNLDREILKAMGDEGVNWRDDVRANTPVDTGKLREDWALNDPVKVGLLLTMDLSNNMEYAEHVEYGHRQEPGRYVPAIGKRLVKDYVKGYYMLRNGTNDLREVLPGAIRKAVERAGGGL